MSKEIFIAGLVVGGLIVYWFLKSKLTKEKNNRKRLAGTYAERFVPFLKKFKYDPADAHFFGKPIDFIVYDGLSEKGSIKNIVFVEVKTSKSQLSKRERELRKAIKNKDVKYELLKV